MENNLPRKYFLVFNLPVSQHLLQPWSKGPDYALIWQENLTHGASFVDVQNAGAIGSWRLAPNSWKIQSQETWQGWIPWRQTLKGQCIELWRWRQVVKGTTRSWRCQDYGTAAKESLKHRVELTWEMGNVCYRKPSWRHRDIPGCWSTDEIAISPRSSIKELQDLVFALLGFGLPLVWSFLSGSHSPLLY